MRFSFLLKKKAEKHVYHLTLEMPKSSDEQAKASNISHYTTQQTRKFVPAGRQEGWVGGKIKRKKKKTSTSGEGRGRKGTGANSIACFVILDSSCSILRESKGMLLN